jgi:pyruvate,orthophosphate dikinase
VLAAVFAAHTTERVALFKRTLGLPKAAVGAIAVQAMVFGNTGPNSAAAVVCSRDPVTGAAGVVGEAVVNGTPADVWRSTRASVAADSLPVYAGLVQIVQTAERIFRHPVIADFVVEDGRPWCTQIAPAQLTAAGRFKAAVALVSERVTEKKDALEAVDADDIRQLVSLEIAAEPPAVLCTGVPAGRECVVGKLCLTPEQVKETQKAGGRPVFVTSRITSADLEVILAAGAVVTTAGTNLSFAAAILRLLRKTAALGCADLAIDYRRGQILREETVIEAGGEITVTGDGRVIAGGVETLTPKQVQNPDALEVLRWADEFRKDKIFVYTTARTAEDVKFAIDIESDGIGTFKMGSLFEGDHASLLKSLADGFNEELLCNFEEHLTVSLEPILQNVCSKILTFELFVPDFPQYFRCPLEVAREIGALKAKAAKQAADAADPEGKPPAVPPPFEHQAELDAKIEELAKLKKLRNKNASIGCAGVRYCLVNADLLTAQYRAIAFAAKSAKAKRESPKLRIVCPLVSHERELQKLTTLLTDEVERYGENTAIGAFLETPRSCLASAQIANAAPFLIVSMPTLTEYTFASSASDGEKTWLKPYRDRGIFKNDIFGIPDPTSVVALMNKAIKAAREAAPQGEVVIYNEDFGKPGTDLLEQYIAVGVNGLICKPAVVPIARLAAAKSVLQATATGK